MQYYILGAGSPFDCGRAGERFMTRNWLTLLRTKPRPIPPWLRSRTVASYLLQSSRFYWQLRHRANKILFWTGARVFGLKNRLTEASESFSILQEIARTIGGQFLLAAVLVGTTWLIEHTLKRLGVLQLLISVEIDGSTYVSILTTFAQISGVFLGLYFTAVSVIASTVYARVPGDVREILTQEKVGNVYIRMVALLASIAMILLAMASLGLSPVLLHLILVTALGVLSILSFVVLGRRAFNFLDPASLADYLARDLARLINSATPRGFQWQNPSFQAHYQRQAERALETYRNILSIVATEERLRGDAIVALASRALGIWRFYATARLRIPSDSQWFRRRYRHPDWFTTDYSEIAIALKTGTQLQPQVVPESTWVETEIKEVLVGSLRALIERDDLERAILMLNRTQQTFTAFGGCFASEEALKIFQALRPEISKVTKSAGESSDPEKLARQLVLLCHKT